MTLTRSSSFVCCKFLLEFSCRMQFYVAEYRGNKALVRRGVVPLLHIPLAGSLPCTPGKLLVAGWGLELTF